MVGSTANYLRIKCRVLDLGVHENKDVIPDVLGLHATRLVLLCYDLENIPAWHIERLSSVHWRIVGWIRLMEADKRRRTALTL